MGSRVSCACSPLLALCWVTTGPCTRGRTRRYTGYWLCRYQLPTKQAVWPICRAWRAIVDTRGGAWASICPFMPFGTFGMAYTLRLHVSVTCKANHQAIPTVYANPMPIQYLYYMRHLSKVLVSINSGDTDQLQTGSRVVSY